MKTSSTAILFFSRSAVSEAEAKPLSYNKTIDRRCYHSMINRTLGVIKKANYPLFHFDEKNQTGDTFGERLVNSVNTIFKFGHERLIIIGNDCPTISQSLLADTDQRLEENNLVLGPSQDGGLYLIGIQKTSFDAEYWLSLPWESNQLNQAFQIYAQKAEIAFHQLPESFDIDSKEDVKLALQSKQINTAYLRKWMQLILHFCFSDSPSDLNHRHLTQHHFTPSLSLRGPPSL